MAVKPIELAVPFVSLNGDRRETLLENLEKAYIAVLAAIDTMRQCCPNGRNAYPVDGLMEKLKVQYQARQEYLQAVADSLEAEAIALQEGNDR